MILESFDTSPLYDAVPSYLYFQFQDDNDLQAFVKSYNEITQGYVDWFNSTPLGVYTNSKINGELLSWIGKGIYGIERPYISNIKNSVYGSTNSYATNQYATNSFINIQSGESSIATDDIYKRVLTWYLYRGDGYESTVQWLRRRIARFVYGINGSDINMDLAQNISITIPDLPYAAGTNTLATNQIATDGMLLNTGLAKRSLEIKIPTSDSAQAFEILVAGGYINLPFQIIFKVTLT